MSKESGGTQSLFCDERARRLTPIVAGFREATAR